MSQSRLMLVCLLAGLDPGKSGLAAMSASAALPGMWAPLVAMTAPERANAELHLCLGPSADKAQRTEAENIEGLWNSGRTDEALAWLLSDQTGIAEA